jgi:intracellular sulfur oxidation DsrE/DsrF family protein
MQALGPALMVCALSAPLAISAGCAPSPASAARHTGPVIQRFGRVYDVPDSGLATPVHEDLKVRFDVSQAAKPGRLNTGFDTAARFLNMHVAAGVPRHRLRVALVVHGPAVADVLTPAASQAKHGRDNPNAELVSALAAAGVRVYVCGQTAAEAGLTRADVTPGATLALSAMTAHLVLAREGYALNPF